MSILRSTMLGFLVVALSTCPTESEATGTDADQRVPIESWLALGPVDHPLPVFASTNDDNAALAEVLDAQSLPVLWRLPAAGNSVIWFSESVVWREVAANDGRIDLDATSTRGESARVCWLATRLDVPRYTDVPFEVTSEHLVKIILDGHEIEGETRYQLTLEPGTHLLEIKTIVDPQNEKPWYIDAAFVGDGAQLISCSTDPGRELGILDILDATRIESFDLSPTGDRVVASVADVRPGTDERETWVEIRTTDDGRLVTTWKGSPAMRQVHWHPQKDAISFVTDGRGEGTSSLWLADLATGTTRALVEEIGGMDSYEWSPTGQEIVYSVVEKEKPDERGITRMQSLLDRMAGHRDVASLFLLGVADGAVRRLTEGRTTTRAEAFSPDGQRLLVTREVEDLSRRPYSRIEVWEIDLESGISSKIRDGRWITQIEYAPDGNHLLVLAGASEFGSAGIAEGLEEPVNEFDGQLFVWEPATDEVRALTVNFDPSVAGVRWNPHDGAIYLLAVDGEHRSLFRCDPASGEFSRIETGIDSIGGFRVASAGTKVVASGTSVWRPQLMVVLDRPGASPRWLFEPAAERFESVRRGRVSSWNFTGSDGREVIGRVYLPTNFDESKRYPAIVNFYGGTSPIGRSFGGRYPAEWWAANGYVVYVLNPTGAYGWGLEASTVHVNDWGEVTSRQIIEATTAFLDEHEFVDPHRVGCIGASYGGFMTMTLVTKTDLFAAAVAHAGISALSSYWGEGYWGYSYGAVANADSFPWNRRDIFVDRSPLFQADRVTTPILLTHGLDDPNVPPGESDQFFAALKLLGSPVEYLRISGLGHLIMEHDKRALWSRSIVAWFDKWLKDEPEWWNALYPEP